MVGVSTAGLALADAVAWHDVECASYDVDLPLWRELAAQAGGGVLDLGCGTGRVALDLAAAGHEVTGVDTDPELVAALRERARETGLAANAHALDVRSLELPGESFALAVAPMQVAQLLGGPAGRAALLERVRAHLEPGAVLALALADPWEGVPIEEAEPPVPDMREAGGWVLSSAPVAVRPEDDGQVALDRLRSAVAPDGDLAEELFTIVLELFDPGDLEAQAARRGYRAVARRRIPGSHGYVGSTVVVLEAT